MHPRQFENLLHWWRGVDQPDQAIFAADTFMNGNQRAQAAAIQEVSLGKIDLDKLVSLSHGCPELVAEHIGVSGTEFRDPVNAENISVALNFHIIHIRKFSPVPI